MTRRLAAPAGLLVLYGFLIAIANQRHLWHDELYTFYIAQAPTLSDLWRDLRVDLNPPLIYLAARTAMSVFGNTAFAVRLPSMLAFFGGSLCLYALVRRHLQSTNYAALAVLIFWSTPAFYFATEARPYALVLGFFSVAMLAWWIAIESPRTYWPILTLAAAVAGMMLSHFFAVLFLTPFFLAEGIRCIRQRRPDWLIAAALLLPCGLPFFFLRMQSGAAFPPAFQAGIRKMVSYYYWTLYEEGWVLLIALCAALAVYRFRNRATPNPPTYTATEATFVASLLALPIVVNSAIMFLHGAFFTRYAAPALLAYPLVLVVLLAKSTNTNRLSAIVMCSLLALYIPAQHLAKPIPKHSNFAQIHPELPLVAASGLTFLEMDHEESLATVNRLYYLTDRESAMKYAHATIFEGLPDFKQLLPVRAHVEPLRQFLPDHPKFLVLGTPDYAEDWLIRYLFANHAKLEFLGNFPSEYKDSQLFLVSLPPAL